MRPLQCIEPEDLGLTTTPRVVVLFEVIIREHATVACSVSSAWTLTSWVSPDQRGIRTHARTEANIPDTHGISDVEKGRVDNSIE